MNPLDFLSANALVITGLTCFGASISTFCVGLYAWMNAEAPRRRSVAEALIGYCVLTVAFVLIAILAALEMKHPHGVPLGALVAQIVVSVVFFILLFRRALRGHDY